MDSVLITNNLAQGGDSPVQKFGGSGGGLFAITTLGSANTITLNGDVLAGNVAAYGNGSINEAGGSGGGATFSGVTAFVIGTQFDSNQFANAEFNLQGEAINLTNPLGTPANLVMVGGSITNHVSNFTLTPLLAAALDVFPGNTAILQGVTFAGNSKDSNADGLPGPPGTIIFQ
jgi:hypothetical protein